MPIGRSESPATNGGGTPDPRPGPHYPLARVTRAHLPPEGEEIHVYPGDPLRIGEESGRYPGWLRCTTGAGRASWIPDAYVRRRGARGTALTEYCSRELPAAAGEIVTLRREIAGWAWARADDGREGWLPLDELEIEAPPGVGEGAEGGGPPRG